MYATHYYNDEPIDPGFTQDMYSNLFGGSRLRQLRIKDRKFVSLRTFWFILELKYPRK